jgi:hypothetical protein
LVIKVDNKKNSNEKKERTAQFVTFRGIDEFKNNVLEVIV